MERIKFSLKRVPEEANKDLDACKLLGYPVMPVGFLDSLHLDENDYFVAQIRCDAFPARPPFPEKGFIYIFVNVNTLKPRVVYTEEEPGEVVDNVNDEFDAEACGDPTCLQMVFDDKGGSSLFGEIDGDLDLEVDVDTEGKLTLLEIDAYSLPEDHKPLTFGDFGMSDGHWVFLIKEEDLIKRKFRNVELVETEA